MKFVAIERNIGRTVTVIRGETDEPIRKIILYLDNETGKVCYPIEIMPLVSGVSIILESDASSSCTFPPSMPDSMIDSLMIGGLMEYLLTFHDVVAAAREFIREEQLKLRDARVE